MPNTVYHAPRELRLNVDRPDLGLDLPQEDIDNVWEEILQPVAARDRTMLLCIARANGEACKAEAAGVKSPHMIIRKQRWSDGSLHYTASHLPTPYEATAEESDKHKATKEFIARTCDKVGLKYEIEKATKNRRARPDVTVASDGGLDLGCEAQYYNLPAGTVRRRTRNHAEAGLVSSWITDDPTFDLVDRANYAVTPRYTWRKIAHAADLPVRDGARVLVEWRCAVGSSDGRPCPNGNNYCGKYHMQWALSWDVESETMKVFSLARIVVGAATGEMSSLFIPARKDNSAGRYLWVPSEHKRKWVERRGGEDLPSEAGDAISDEVEFAGREADESCRYGEPGFAPSAARPKRGLGSIGLTMTFDVEPSAEGVALAPGGLGPGVSAAREAAGGAVSGMPVPPPPTTRVTPGKCGTGRPACGQPARFYPAGWRCPAHAPGE